jgi:uncharacterized protein
MVPMILRFVGCARAAGLRVSTSEVLDCLQHLTWVDPLEELQFKSVLQANFAKSRREQVHFERLYHLFFHELRQDASIARSPHLAQAIPSILESLQAEDGDRPTQALLEFLAGDPVGWLEQLTGAGDRLPMPATAGSVALNRYETLARSIRRLADRFSSGLSARRDDLEWEERRDLMEHFQDCLNAARRLVTERWEDRRPLEERRRSYRHILDEMGTTHFTALTAREVDAMREAIEQLVRRLKDRIGRRRTARRRGTLDVKKTLRRAAAYQGLPFELKHRRRPRRKAKVVTLCDVSGSVWAAARFMLNMLYALQDCFTQVRSFIFVAGLAEVTDVFKRYPINAAIDKILKEADIDYNAATDYGQSLKEFRRDYMEALTPQTTLIIIGDGRCNFTHPEEHILAEMRTRSRRLIWLNPEARQFWYTGDSEMRVFETVCDEVRPCQNLNQLLEFITTLVV